MERLTKRDGLVVHSALKGDWATQNILHKLAEYEDLEEQGKMIVLPCKAGDDVYFIPSKANYKLNVLSKHEENNRVYHQKIARIIFGKDYWYVECDKDIEYGTGEILVGMFFGETWFLDEAEAEKALAEIEK